MSAMPRAELDLTETAELVAIPDTTGRDGEHPRWTAAMRQAVSDHETRTQSWRASVEAQARRDRELPIGDDFGRDEPTRADRRFPG